MLLGLVLHKNFAPETLPDYVTSSTSVITDIVLGDISVKIASCHLPQSAYDQWDPDALVSAQHFITQHLAVARHCVLLGDLNAWLGKSCIAGLFMHWKVQPS
eukprot:6474641-Amphidinium_carterae.1